MLAWVLRVSAGGTYWTGREEWRDGGEVKDGEVKKSMRRGVWADSRTMLRVEGWKELQVVVLAVGVVRC